ncbi:Tuberous sclerosis 2-like protein [Tilletia horrida]|nr:Tuberous sclerosis 2-like protein [Tilletia horrida]
MSLLRNRSRSSTISSPSIPALDTSHAAAVGGPRSGSQAASTTASTTTANTSAVPSPRTATSPSSAPPARAAFASGSGSSSTSISAINTSGTTTASALAHNAGSSSSSTGISTSNTAFADANYLDLVLHLPRPQRIDLTQYRMHLELLHQPLPSSSNARRTAIAEREICLTTLSGAVAYELKTRPSAAAFAQARSASIAAGGNGISDDHGYAFVGSSNMLQLVLLLLSQEQPVPIHAAALDLLALSIHLADGRCPPSRIRSGALPLSSPKPAKGSSAAPPLTTISYSSSSAAAPTSGQTGVSPNDTIAHDEPVADVERAAFYQLITNHDLSHAAAALSGGGGADDPHGARERLAVIALPTLLPQLRALKALGGHNSLQLGYLPNIVPLLVSWLSAVWPELQILRRKLIALQQVIERSASSGAVSSNTTFTQNDVRVTVIVKQLEVAERALQSCFELLANLFKFSFSKIDPAHTELALVAVSTLIVGSPTVPSADTGKTSTNSNSSMLRAAFQPGEKVDGAPTSRPRGEGSASRSKSRDAKVLREGAADYGMEAPESATPSPAMRSLNIGQEGGSFSASATAATAAAATSASGLPAAVSATPLIAPMALATLPPSGRLDSMRMLPNSSFAGEESPDVGGPILHPSDVEASTKLVDAILRYGLLPSASIEPMTGMICKILGYGPARRFAESQRRAASWTTASIAAGEGKGRAEGDGIQDFDAEMASLLANLLRNHCANAALRPAWELLAKPDRARLQSWSGAGGGGTGGAAQEDISVLVGAIRFLKAALRFTAEERQSREVRGVGEGASPGEGGGGGGGGGVGASGGGGGSDSAQLPFMPLSLLFVALRGALQRQSDLLDLEVLHLVAELLPAKAAGASGGSTATATATGNQPPPYFDEPLTHSDWNSILDLTALARRHVEGWKLRGTVPSPFDSSRRSSAQDSSWSVARPSSPVTALVELLQRIQIAPPPTGEDSGPQSPRPDEGDLSVAHVLPWTPKLATLLLALAPQLPDNKIVDLVQYYRVEHFCVPATPEWISNIRALLQALYHRHDAAAREFAASPAPRARKSVASLIFEHVWSVVRDVPADRSKLMLEIIIPLGGSLSSETDPEVEGLLRKMLVDAAAVAGSAPDEGETEEALESNCKNDRLVFNEVRRMLIKFARGSDSTSSLPQSDFGPGPHVSFNLPKGEDSDSGDEFGSHRPLPPRTWGAARSLRPDNIPLSAKAAADLIAIFNRMAFGSAAAVRILTASKEQRDRWEASQRAVWQKKIRGSCITVLRDLLALLQPTLLEDVERVPAATLPENAFLEQDGTSSVIARLVILQWILRLRTDRHHRIYLETKLDDLVEPAAAIVLRGADEAQPQPQPPTPAAAPMSAQSSGERPGRRGRLDRSAAVTDPVARSRSKRRDRSRSMGPRGQQSGPLWTLPTVLLFELPPNQFRSGVVFTFIHRDTAKDSTGEDKPEPLYISEWLATVVNFFRYESNWDLMSYLICHLPHQLANKHLFNGPRAHIQVEHLRELLCSGMTDSNLAPFVELRADDAKKTDLYALAYNSLTVLMSYRKLFKPDQQDDMVKAFLAGLNKSSTTAQPCIRALSIACYDLQKSVSRQLSGSNGLLGKLSKVMSSMTMSVHILELMAILVRLPACYANLNEDDYKLVFQICISYIQYHQSPQASGREDFKSSPQTFSLSQYVMMLAYFDLAVWFTTLHVSERPKYVADITRRMLIGCPIVDGEIQITEQTETMFDFLARCTYSNLDPRPTKSYIGQVVMPAVPLAERNAKESSKSTKSRSWLVGKGLMTVVASKKTGWSEIVIRRPSGTTSLLVKAENSALTAHLEDGGFAQLLEALKRRAEDGADVVASPDGQADGAAAAGPADVAQALIGSIKAAPEPSHIALQLSNYPDLSKDKTPIPAPNDSTTERLLRNVDFVPVVDLHKLSVLWVGPGQKTEQAILGNRQGSPAFMRFLSGLGELFTLKDRMDLPTSLDRTHGMHGKYAYMWSDHIMQVFYHTATLMPNLPHDPTFTNKKALIGNDPVHIVFNESGDEYRFDSIPSQFNSINIVISPTYKGGTNMGAVSPDDDIFYRVSLQRQVNLPDFSPIGDGQLISADALPGFVRVLAINSNLMAQIYNATAETMTPYQSNWVERLRYISRFREKLVRERSGQAGAAAAGSGGSSQAQTSHQFTQVF